MNSRNLRTMAVMEEEKEALVPLLCVFKNGVFLHSVLLSDPEWDEEENNADSQEEILKVGRHPDCDIVVDHPSISRWHLQIQLHKSSQELLLTDLSSVHGTYVCGQRATPKVPVTLRPDDTFRMGASTRVYKLQWLPYYPSEEEEDCPTPKFLHSVYEPNKHECASDGENKQALTEEGHVGAAESNSWNMECGLYNDKNKEQALMEEGYVKAVESVPNNQECGFNDENEQASEKDGYAKAVESTLCRKQMETAIFLESVSETNKQECTFGGENKEQALKEHRYVEAVDSVQSNPIKTPLFLECVSEPNKQDCAFAVENKEQVLKGHGYVESVKSNPVKTPIVLESFSEPNEQECASEPNKQECAFSDENKEQVLKEHRYVEAVESVRSNPIKIPIFLECVSEPNKQDCACAVENKEQVLKEHGYVESAPSNPVKTPRVLESFSEPNEQECASEPNEQECAFSGENKEQALEEHIYVERVPSNRVKTPIFLESVSEPNKQEHEFAGENHEHLEEHGYVKPVESVPSNLVKTPIFLRSVSEPNEQALEEHIYVERVPSNQVKTPIFLESVSESNKQECEFAGENHEQALEEHGYVKPVESVPSNLVKTPIFLRSVSEPNEQDCAFAGEKKEHALEEHRYVEPVPSNPVKTPIFLESVSEPHKQECVFSSGNKEQVLKEHGYVEAELVHSNLTPILSDIILEPNKQECGFDKENKEQVSIEEDDVKVVESNPRNLMFKYCVHLLEKKKEQALKEHGYVEVVKSVPSNQIKTPIFLEYVSESNKQDCAFACENKEQGLKEYGYVSVPSNPVKTPIILESFSEPNERDRAFSGENKEQILKEHGYVEPVPSKLVKTPTVLESVSERNKQKCAFASERKEHGYVEAEHVHSNLTPILSDIILQPNKQECGFDEENKKQASMEEGDAKVVESDPRDLECGFVDQNTEQFLMEEEYVEPVESILWKPVQPSAPPLPESPQQNIFAVVTEAEMTPLQENQSLMREKNAGIGDSNLWSRRQKDGNLVCLQTGRMEINLKPKKMKEKLTKQKRILKENSSAEIILKENHVRCDKKNRGLNEKKRDSVLQVLQPETSAHGSSSTGFYQVDNDLYPSDKENWTPKVSGQASKATTRNFGRVDQEIHPQTDTGRAPFQSLSQNSRVNNRSTINSSLKNTNKSMDNHQGLHSEVQVLGRVQHPNLADSKKKWHMVVDTDCLVHEESRQALKQLEGIKGTHLIIPRIVIRELDCLKRRNKSKKGKEAQEILRWIDECMVNKGWWIHVQNSTECFTAGVTPPASPHSNLSDGSNDASASVAFSSYGSFADVLSPTAEDHILECALLYKRLATGGRVVLLSNDVALKIKAMAEGMLCENAKEFCQSLVSPYSERFLWSQSTAHGHNWTDINNSGSRKSLGMTRKSTYFGMMRKSLLHDEESKKKSNEGAKGLKLILLHNSQYGQKKHI